MERLRTELLNRIDDILGDINEPNSFLSRFISLEYRVKALELEKAESVDWKKTALIALSAPILQVLYEFCKLHWRQ